MITRASLHALKPMAALCLLASLASGEERAQVDYKPLKVIGMEEFGQIRKGTMPVDNAAFQMEGEWMDRFGAFVIQEALVEQRLRLEVGLGGIFEFPKDQRKSEVFAGSEWKNFYIGPPIAKATVLFGNPEAPRFTVGGGLFPFKYNPDAANLGEYLFRSTPYPTTIFNGGYLAINDNAANLQGLHANAKVAGLNLDFLVTTETRMPPLYDWSVSGLAEYKIADGLLELGAGISFHRLLQVRPSRTSREAARNSYFERDGQIYSGYLAYYDNQKTFWNRKGEEFEAKGDTTLRNDAFLKRDAFGDIVDSISGPWTDTSTGLPYGAKFYTTAGTLVMGRAAVDFKKMFGIESMSPADFRLYCEVAVLGLESQGLFYRKVQERMPIMAGFNLPTFGWLDLFSVQVEHFGSKFQNSTYELGNSNHALPYLPGPLDAHYSKDEYNDLATKDDLSWSVLLRKTFFKSLSFNAQFAKDNYRPVSNNDYTYGPHLMPNNVTQLPDEWYWAVQVGWGI